MGGNQIGGAADRRRGWNGRFGGAGALMLSVLLAAPASAQTAFDIPMDHGKGSAFTLSGIGDFGRIGMRTSGAFMPGCISNESGMHAPRNNACTTAPLLFNSSRGLTEFLNFEAPFFILAPPGDLPDGIDASALDGGGWTAHTRSTLPFDQIELRASDRSGRDLLNIGVVSTADGSCRDFRGTADGRIPAGTQLLPHTNCRDTWPAAADAWPGMKRITLENFIAAQSVINPTGDGDPFAFWSVPEELTTGQPLGNQAIFGEFVDWSVDQMPNYSSAIPGGGGGGRPVGSWPTGLTVRFDGFYFGLPGVNNAYFIQYTIINDSERVYGTGADYDSLYVGTMFLEGNNSQQQAFFTDIPRGGLYIRNCDNNPPNGAPTPYGGAPSTCVGAGFGWGAGAQGVLVLKSPIGDLRNKHLTDPASPFFNPAHPNAGDTITYNHRHGCGFISCTDFTMSYSERATFGLYSSTLENLLDGRDPSEFSDVNYWNSVYPTEVWPTRGDFNKYVPGIHDNNPIWDYNHDGIPDTLYVDVCGSRGCVPLWEDTLPGGWQNRQGQTAPLAVGPFALQAGDTTGLLIAMIADRDSAAFESTIQNIYDLYQSFFLVPEAAPPSNVQLSTVGVTGGERGDAEVRLNLDDAASSFVDQFLLQLAGNIEEADPETDFGKLRVLNPGLVDEIRARATDNVAAIHIFKSCDGGTTFTDDGDCFPDAVNANDATSKWNGFGFLPWQTATPTTSVVIDNGVTAGITYLYSIVTETRGFTANVLQDTGPGEVPTDAEGEPVCNPTRCAPAEIEFSPSLLSPLNKTADARGVISVYVPLSRPAGTIAETVTVESDLGPALVPVSFSTTEGLRNGTFRAVFSGEFEVTQEITTQPGAGGTIDTVSVTTTVVSVEGETFTGTAPVSIRNGTLVEDEEFPAPGNPDRTVHRTVHTVSASPVAMVLLDTSTSPAAGPILATGTLSVGSTTPGTFLNNPRFPGFFIDVDAARGGAHGSEVFIDASGTPIRTNLTANTTVEWLEGGATNLAGVFGQYVISWSDRPYGPGEIFTVSPGIEQRFAESLSARQGGSSSVTSAEAQTAIAIALGSEEEPAEVTLAAVSLPFTIENTTDGRAVQVAVIEHAETVLFGFDLDTMTLSVPADQWIPGDRLVLLEQIEGELTPTWEVTLGCSAASGLREACSATTGSTGNAYSPVIRAGVDQVVTYFRQLSPDATFTVTSTARRLDPAAVAQQLDQIRVVPNPYVMFSQFERNANTRVLKWTHMPPEGTLRIFTLTGQFVQQIDWTEGDLTSTGDLNWNMRTRENTELAYGLYLWVLESPEGEARGKFVVIR